MDSVYLDKDNGTEDAEQNEDSSSTAVTLSRLYNVIDNDNLLFIVVSCLGSWRTQKMQISMILSKNIPEEPSELPLLHPLLRVMMIRPRKVKKIIE